MKKISLSLAVIAMIATAANAEMKSESFGGSASLFYGTNDAGDGDMFNKDTSYGNTAINLGGVASVGSCDTCTKLNYGLTGVSTMGLQHTLVSNTWVDQEATINSGGGLKIDDAIWIDTLNLAFTPLDGISNTTLVVGRQELATPMAFTETWNIAKNTFDAVVAVNGDIQETTLVGAWVARSNGFGVLGTPSTLSAGAESTVRARNISGGFERFLTDEGAYAFGAVTKLIPTVTAQAWYYIAPSTTNVAWLQAEAEYAGFSLGGQFGMLDARDDSDGNAMAVKLGYNYEGLDLGAAYSQVDTLIGTANAVGFRNLAGLQSALYTEAWWNYGVVGESDTDTFTASATYGIENIADLGLFFTLADNGATDRTMQEIAITAGKSIENLDITLAYINADFDEAGVDAQNDIQAYFTYNF
jgi:hypothetical protein